MAEGAKDSDTPLRGIGYLSWVGSARLGKQPNKPEYSTMSDEELLEIKSQSVLD